MSSHPPDYDPNRQGQYPPQWNSQPDDHTPYSVGLAQLNATASKLTIISIRRLPIHHLPNTTVPTIRRRNILLHPIWLPSTRMFKGRIPTGCPHLQEPIVLMYMRKRRPPRWSIKQLRRASVQPLPVGTVAGGRYVQRGITILIPMQLWDH